MHCATEDYHEQHHRHSGGCHNHSHHHDHTEYVEDGEDALYEYYGELDQKEGLKLLMDVLEKLQTNGSVKLSDHQVSISEDIGFSITHEETWDETEKLTLEIEWYPTQEEHSLAETEEEDTPEPPPLIS